MFIKIKYENMIVNVNHIVSIKYIEEGYHVRMSNGDWCRITSDEFELLNMYIQKTTLC